MKKINYYVLHIICLVAVAMIFSCTNKNQTNTHQKEQAHKAQFDNEYNMFKQPRNIINDVKIVAERDAFLKKNGSFRNLLQSQSVIKTSALANWIECGPNGSFSLWPGGAGFSANGKMLSIEQDYSNRNILYVGASGGGVWRSIDAGQTWDVVKDDLPCASVSSIACNPNVPGEVWLGTGAMFNGDAGSATPLSGYLYKTTDYGVTWTQVTFTSTSPVYARINKIVIPLISQNFIGIAAEDGFYASINHGTSFTKLSSVGNVVVTDVVDISDTNSIGTSKLRMIMSVANTKTMKRLTWNTTSPVSVTPDLIEDIICTPNADVPIRTTLTSSRTYSHPNVYASYAKSNWDWGGVFLSTDKGANWRKKTIAAQSGQMGYNLGAGVDNYDGNLAFFGTQHTQLDLTDDSTFTWKTTTSPSAIHADHHAICSSWSDNDTTYMVGDAGFHIIYGNGYGYTMPGKFRNFLVRNLAINPSNPMDRYVATWDNGVYHSANGMADNYEWVGCCDGVDVCYSPTRHLFTIANGGVYKWDTVSQSYPLNNSSFNAGLAGGGAANVIFNNTNFYMNQGLYVYKSNGINLPWTKVGGTNQTFSAGVWHMDATPAGKVAASTWGGSTIIPIRVTDAAGNFMPPSIGQSASASWWLGQTCWQIKFGQTNLANNKPYIYGVLSGTVGRLVVKSDDGGESFTDASGNLPSFSDANCILPDDVDSNIVYLGTSIGVFVTIDGGANWFNYSENLPTASHVSDLDIAYINGTKYIFASCYGRSVWYSATVDSVLAGVITPSQTIICTVLPNPVLDFATVTINDALAKKVTVTIYDVQGKAMSKEELNMVDFSAKLNCSSLPKGLYYLSIAYNTKRITKKLLKF